MQLKVWPPSFLLYVAAHPVKVVKNLYPCHELKAIPKFYLYSEYEENILECGQGDLGISFTIFFLQFLLLYFYEL